MRFVSVKQVFLLLLLLSNVRCGLRIGESVDPESVQGFSIGCLNDAGEKIQSYFAGKAKVSQIHELAGCIKSALNVFKEQVQGNTVDEFTPNELRKFIQELFLQDRVISDPLLEQLIHLKGVIIGGSEDKLTKSDIDQFIVFIEVLTKELVVLQPYIQVLYSPEENFLKLNKPGQLEELQDNLRKSISRISSFAKNFSYSYAFSDIEVLIRELDIIADGQEDIQDLEKNIEIIKLLKSISVSGSPEEIAPKEWGDLLLSYFYFISFTSHYSILTDSELISVQSMQHVRLMLSNFLNFLSQAVRNHPDQVVPESEFTELVIKLESMQWMPAALNAQVVNDILTIVFGKMFNVDRERYGIIELSYPQLQKMQQILSSWMETQSILDDYSIKEDTSVLDAVTEQMIAPFAAIKNILFGESSTVLYEIFSLKPLYRESDKVHLSHDIYTIDVQSFHTNYKNLTIYNFYHLVAEMIKAGYSSDGLNIRQSEIENFFNDFYPVQIVMGLVPKADSSYLGRGEMEFLFTKMGLPSSKGFMLNINKEEKVSSNEVAQYLSYAFSIAFSLKKLYSALSKRCLLESDNTQLIDPHLLKYGKNCVQSYLLSDLHAYIENMPDLILVLQNMESEDKESFIQVLMEIAFDSKELSESSPSITNYQIRYMFTALYLIETTMNRFDSNNDFILQREELWVAYKIFEGFLRRAMVELACIDDLDLLPAIYAHTVNAKDLPLDPLMSQMDKWLKQEILLPVGSFLLNELDYNYLEMELNHTDLTQLYSNLGKVFIRKKKETQTTPCLN